MLVSEKFHGLEQGVPRLGTESSKPWYKEFHALKQRVPRLGTKSFGPWNNEFRALEQRVPGLGTESSGPWNREFRALEQRVSGLGTWNLLAGHASCGATVPDIAPPPRHSVRRQWQPKRCRRHSLRLRRRGRGLAGWGSIVSLRHVRCAGGPRSASQVR